MDPFFFAWAGQGSQVACIIPVPVSPLLSLGFWLELFGGKLTAIPCVWGCKPWFLYACFAANQLKLREERLSPKKLQDLGEGRRGRL